MSLLQPSLATQHPGSSRYGPLSVPGSSRYGPLSVPVSSSYGPLSVPVSSRPWLPLTRLVWRDVIAPTCLEQQPSIAAQHPAASLSYKPHSP